MKPIDTAISDTAILVSLSSRVRLSFETAGPFGQITARKRGKQKGHRQAIQRHSIASNSFDRPIATVTSVDALQSKMTLLSYEDYNLVSSLIHHARRRNDFLMK